MVKIVILTGNWKQEWDNIATVADAFPYLEGLLALRGYFYRPMRTAKEYENQESMWYYDIGGIYRYKGLGEDLRLYIFGPTGEKLQAELEASRPDFIKKILRGDVFLYYAPRDAEWRNKSDAVCEFHLRIEEGKRRCFEPVKAILSFKENLSLKGLLADLPSIYHPQTDLEKKIKESYRRLRTLF